MSRLHTNYAQSVSAMGLALAALFELGLQIDSLEAPEHRKLRTTPLNVGGTGIVN